MAYYEVSKPTTTYYTSFVVSVRVWKSLGDIPAKTWAALEELGLDTWKKLADANCVTLYYTVDKPS
jgi:hypothetical protein